eukprot:365085-Chlamydomonas_euryale.AAC.2
MGAGSEPWFRSPCRQQHGETLRGAVQTPPWVLGPALFEQACVFGSSHMAEGIAHTMLHNAADKALWRVRVRLSGCLAKMY